MARKYIETYLLRYMEPEKVTSDHGSIQPFGTLLVYERVEAPLYLPFREKRGTEVAVTAVLAYKGMEGGANTTVTKRMVVFTLLIPCFKA
jgi:hypothetical protein